MYYIYRYNEPEDERQEDIDEWSEFRDESPTNLLNSAKIIIFEFFLIKK